MTTTQTPTELAEESVESIQGANPFVGLTAGRLALAAGRWAGALAKQPAVLGAGLSAWISKETDVVLGRSMAEPDKRDRRFSDPIWQNPVWRRVLQSYIVTRESLFETVNRVELDPKSADRARFALMQLTEATAPTNNLLTNPVPLRAAGHTRGKSLIDGGRHFVWDLRNNGGLPSQVDTRPFRLGRVAKG